MHTNNQYTNHQLTPDGITVDLNLALSCDASYDPDSLLGNRFLCRGSGGLLVAQSGLGKSTFAFQMACHLAVGKEFFGINKTHKDQPLKVVLVQSENDAKEIAEVIQSVTENWTTDEVETLKHQLVVKNVWDKMGTEFGRWLRDLTTKCNPDLVIVDPLMGYLGGDVLSNEAITTFMREEINNALKNPPQGCRQFGLIFVHHTGKPATPGRKDDKPTTVSRMYNMLGASELVNWARFIMRLDPAMEQGRAIFTIPKRGDRSGVQFLAPEEEWGCYIQHAAPNPNSKKRVMRWESAGPSLVPPVVVPTSEPTVARKPKDAARKAKVAVQPDQVDGQSLLGTIVSAA